MGNVSVRERLDRGMNDGGVRPQGECISIDRIRAVSDEKTVYESSEALRTIADAVQTLGAKVLEARPPLVEHVAETECNAHLLAHKLYGDFTRAAEIVRLNPQIRNPNFIAKGQALHVYAD